MSKKWIVTFVLLLLSINIGCEIVRREVTEERLNTIGEKLVDPELAKAFPDATPEQVVAIRTAVVKMISESLKATGGSGGGFDWSIIAQLLGSVVSSVFLTNKIRDKRRVGRGEPVGNKPVAA